MNSRDSLFYSVEVLKTHDSYGYRRLFFSSLQPHSQPHPASFHQAMLTMHAVFLIHYFVIKMNGWLRLIKEIVSCLSFAIDGTDKTRCVHIK